MKICDEHWQALRAAVDKYQLGHLIAQDGTQAAGIMKRELEGTATALDFDPLMSAHNQLVSVAMGFIGAIKLMTGDNCPVCQLQQYDWIDGAAYQSWLFASKNGLLIQEGGVT